MLLFGAVFGLTIHKPDLVALGAAILASILTLALLLTARRDMPERRWFVAGEIVTLFGLMALLLSR